MKILKFLKPITILALTLVMSQDAFSQKMYWADMHGNKIQRANLDGTNVEDIVTNTPSPQDVALDVNNSKIYWTNCSSIQRAGLDGTMIETVLGVAARGIALDLTNSKIYWTICDVGRIQRANLDGSNIENLVTSGSVSPFKIALDLVNGKMYWTDRDNDLLKRANLDGSNIENLITSRSGNLNGIALDISAAKMYWTDDEWVERANLDGSGRETLTSSLVSGKGLALDVSDDRVYWCDGRFPRIQRSRLNGGSIESLVASGLSLPDGIALDLRVTNPPFALTVSPSPLKSGQSGTFTVNNGAPSERAWLVYSLDGGSCSHFFQPLNVVFDICNPSAQPGNPVKTGITDANGDITWMVSMPGVGSSRPIWFQAVQRNRITSVVSTTIQP